MARTQPPIETPHTRNPKELPPDWQPPAPREHIMNKEEYEHFKFATAKLPTQVRMKVRKLWKEGKVRGVEIGTLEEIIAMAEAAPDLKAPALVEEVMSEMVAEVDDNDTETKEADDAQVRQEEAAAEADDIIIAHPTPRGPLTYVRCPLPGYDNIEVGFDLNARFDAIRGKVRNDDGLGLMRQMHAIAGDFRGWNLYNDVADEPYRAPRNGNLTSYLPLAQRLWPLGEWIIGDGLREAVRQELKN